MSVARGPRARSLITPGARQPQLPVVAGASAVPALDARVPAPEATAAADRSGAHFPCIEGLRALAALAIVVLHVTFLSGHMFQHGYGRYLARLDIGVPIFFVISGCLLYQPFVSRHLGGRPSLDVRRYALRRLLRIIPAYWVALAVTCFVARTHPVANAGEAMVLFGFGQIYSGHLMHHGIQQAWSLCTEMTFYAFLPLWAVALRSVSGSANARPTDEGQALAPSASARPSLHGPGRPVVIEVAGVALLFILGLAVRLSMSIARPSPLFIGYAWLPTNIDLFALGMGLAVARAHADAGGRLPQWLAAAGRWPVLSWAVAISAFWLVSNHAGLRLDYGDLHAGQWMSREILYGVASACLVAPVVLGDQRRGPGRRALASRPVVVLGLVSYGVYLWHELWQDEWRRWTGYRPFTGHVGSMMVTVLGLGLAVAALSYVAVERPFLRLKPQR